MLSCASAYCDALSPSAAAPTFKIDAEYLINELPRREGAPSRARAGILNASRPQGLGSDQTEVLVSNGIVDADECSGHRGGIVGHALKDRCLCLKGRIVNCVHDKNAAARLLRGV